MKASFVPRGIRNNNPGNIRLSSARWQGADDPHDNRDSAFVTFKDPVMGLRALMRVLLTYQQKHGLRTIESIINRWAPPHENHTERYILHVCQNMHIGRRHIIDLRLRKTLVDLARAITIHENGFPSPENDDGWYPPHMYESAASKALSPISSQEN